MRPLRSSTPRRALIVLLAVVAAAGCGGGGSRDGEVARAGDETTDDAEATTTSRVVACEAGDLDPRTLAPMIVEEVEGFTQEADDVGETGPSDLAKAILDDGERDAERVLNETGFRGGYQRLWSNEAGDEVILFVYEFCKEDGAARYGSRTFDIFAAARLPIEPVVAEVGTGFTLANESMRGVWLWENAGPVLVMVVTHSEQVDAAGLLARITPVLAAQLERISASDAATPA